ncbi:MAG: hypothetical protein Q8K82_16355 [Gemmatimonadaceae bacterium]|nr:hypothetical protein [Gemmatimonadaceae bacterium]
MSTIRSQADLDRANIHLAWALASTMTPAHFDELCHVTLVQMRRDAGCEDAGSIRRYA